MSYRVWSEEEIANRNLIAEGDYLFSCLNCVEKRTKSDDAVMWEIDLLIKDMNGVEKKLKDWIVFMEGLDWKLRHLARTTGLIEMYESGAMKPTSLIGKRGYLKLGKRINNKTGQLVNNVMDYLISTSNGYASASGKNANKTSSKPESVPKDSFNDDIPF